MYGDREVHKNFTKSTSYPSRKIPAQGEIEGSDVINFSISTEHEIINFLSSAC